MLLQIPPVNGFHLSRSFTGSSVRCRILDLEECRGLGEETLAALFKPDALPALERLTLDGIAEVSDSLLTEAGLALPSLQVSALWALP